MAKQRRLLNNSFFEEVSIDILIDICGIDFINEFVNPYLIKLSDLDKVDFYDLKIVKERKQSIFNIYNVANDELLFQINPCIEGWFFCKPTKLLSLLAGHRMEYFEREITQLELDNSTTIIDDLFALNELPINDHLVDYLYNMGIIFVEEFNLELDRSRVTIFDEDSLVIHGMKEEFVENKSKNKIEMKEVSYVLDFKLNSRFILITKIFSNNKKEVVTVNIDDFLLQGNDILFEWRT